MTVQAIIDSLPNGFHDSYVEKFEIDWQKEKLTFELRVWMDNPEPGERFKEDYRNGRLILSGIKNIQFPRGSFPIFEIGTEGAWIDVDTDFANVGKNAEPFVPKEKSVWMFFRDYSEFLFFDADTAEFSWLD